MNIRHLILLATLLLTVVGSAQATDRRGYDKLVAEMDAARLVEANIFAPKTWQKAKEAFLKAKEDLERNKKQENLDKHVAEAAEYTANAVKATEVGKLSLQEYLRPRELAREAGAPALVTEIYREAEQQWLKATKKVEEGNVKDALKEAAKSKVLFDGAEMEAIRVDLLGGADRLLEKAHADDAGKYALSTLDKAQTARDRANTILTTDRYNRTESLLEIERAEYEARHASNIALSVRSLSRNDQAWEKLMLVYEIQMNRVGESFNYAHLPFDDGPQAAADRLLADISTLQRENEQVKRELEDVGASLGNSLTHLGVTTSAKGTTELAALIDERVGVMLAEKQTLSRRLTDGQADLDELALRQEAIQGELSVRLEQEKKFKKAKTRLNPSEGEVLYNAANDVVLRLHGLSFGVGRSEIADDHVGLLAKVQEVIGMYPDAQLVIEGHTDTTGDAAANLALSEKRAFAVMQYLREATLIPADRVRSIGYGADRPVGSNKTADGRAKNRRIDIIIMK